MSDRVCLLITCFNRSQQLNRSLERLCKLTIPDEILIVDDGGNDNCENTVMNFKGRLPVRYLYNNNPEWSICSMARNIGIKNTDCDIIITAEPEILYITDVIKQMLESHGRNPGKVISAGTIYHMGENAILHNDMIHNPLERLKVEAVNNSPSDTYPYDSTGYAKIQEWVAPYSALYRREWLLQINGWDESFIHWGFDDTDLLTRLQFNRVGQYINTDIEVIHQWHSKLPPEIQMIASRTNESIMKSKVWEGENNDIVANKNKDWGIIKI